MEYPQLLLAIRDASRTQYEVAAAAGMRPGRLSEILRRGKATPEEKVALSRVLGVSVDRLFSPVQ